MKKIISILLSIFLLSVVGLSVETYSPANKIAEEEYVDDIPFNTKDVFESKVLQLEEEQCVDDIPFNTKEIFDTIKNK